MCIYLQQHQSAASHASLTRAEEVVQGLSQRLLSLAEQCRGCVERGGGARQDVAQCRTTQARLCAEARLLVTSSKLLVQAATAEVILLNFLLFLLVGVGSRGQIKRHFKMQS